MVILFKVRRPTTSAAFPAVVLLSSHGRNVVNTTCRRSTTAWIGFVEHAAPNVATPNGDSEMRYVIAVLVGVLVPYLIGTFIEWNWNPGEWVNPSRLFTGLFGFVFLAWCFLITDTYNKK